MEKLDLSKKYKAYYSAKTKPEILHVAPAQFLSLYGKGDPSGEEFANNIQALYATAYAIKFHYKALDKDFVVAKLECLWWYDDKKYKNITIENAPKEIPRSEWSYRLLIRMPEFVTKDVVKKAISDVVIKKEIPLAEMVEVYDMHEGKCVQMLHIGPFDKEPETLLQMQAFMQAGNMQQNGLHHEIYLSDFRKTVPEKLKTILREPVV